MADATMRYSTRDMVAFVGALRRQIVKVTKAMARQHGSVFIPKDIRQCMEVATSVYWRFLSGDWRHTDTELVRCKLLADWLVAEHAALTGGEAKPWAFDAAGMVSNRPAKVDGRRKYKSS